MIAQYGSSISFYVVESVSLDKERQITDFKFNYQFFLQVINKLTTIFAYFSFNVNLVEKFIFGYRFIVSSKVIGHDKLLFFVWWGFIGTA